MSALRSVLRVRGNLRGGILSYPLAELYEEVAYIAYHFHWPMDEILAMEHAVRRVWVGEIAKIVRRINDGE